jgi:transcriptional repressor NrdR
MKCPYCSYTESKVTDSRPTEDGLKIRRRRECVKCGGRFTTYEVVENTPIIVIKKDKSRQVFSREKLLNGLMRACEKRPVSVETLEKVVDDIEFHCASSLSREIRSNELGELVLSYLKDIDEVAYVRFASVYREFSDVESFMLELNELLDSRKGN